MNTKLLGNQGETVAAQYLRAHGYIVVVRQYRCPMGEIDIVARRGHTWIFVEVKTRRSTKYGQPALAVNYRKQQKIIRVATWYLHQYDLNGVDCRFDVMEVYWQSEHQYHIEHYENAFEVG